MTTATVIPIRREFQVHRFDPIKHGVLSKHIALPWEDRTEFEGILRGLLVEHSPQGPTAYHLVEDLAGVIWRKRRLLQAEGAAIRTGLHNVAQNMGHETIGRYARVHKAGSIKSRLANIVADRLPDPDDLQRDLVMIRSAEALLTTGKPSAYKKAMAALNAALSDRWENEAADASAPEDGGYSRDAEGLSEFLSETRTWCEARLADHACAPSVRAEAHAMAIDIRELEGIAKIEAHLDRKMLGLLAELRRMPRSKYADKSTSG